MKLPLLSLARFIGFDKTIVTSNLAAGWRQGEKPPVSGSKTGCRKQSLYYPRAMSKANFVAAVPLFTLNLVLGLFSVNPVPGGPIFSSGLDFAMLWVLPFMFSGYNTWSIMSLADPCSTATPSQRDP